MAGTLLRPITYDGNLIISTGSSATARIWMKTDITWRKFLERLEIPVVQRHTRAQYEQMVGKDKTRAKDVGGYVGGQLQDTRRGKNDVVFRSMITLDIDNAQSLDITWQLFLLTFGCAGALHTTHSHTPESPRARLIIPLKFNITPGNYVIASQLVADSLGLGIFDKTTHEANRLMFWPSIGLDGQKDYRFEYNDADWLDINPMLKRHKETELLHELSQEDPAKIPGLVGAFNKVYSIHGVIEKYLSDVYLPAENGRYKYADADSAPGVVVYEGGRYCYSHHANDPAQGKLCHAFDLVCIHKFNGFKDDVLAWIKENKICTSQDAEGITVNSKGKTENSIRNMRIILDEDTRIAKAVTYDEFAGKLMVYGDFPWLGILDREIFTWTDADDAGLREFFETHYGLTDRLKIFDALALTALQNKVHPVRQYLLKTKWDGEPRLDSLLVDFLNAEDSAYTRAVTRKALIGAVARIFSPGCKHDHVLVLVGPQGCRKSTTIGKLGQKWYTDSLYSMQGKEAYELLQGYWIIEISEMAAARKSDIEQMKQFITKQSDNFRAAYDRRTIDHPRQCAFFGSTNDDEFLKDYTGNRRFWPVAVGLVPEEKYAGLTDEYIAQVWAEAHYAFTHGENWYLSIDMEQQANNIQTTYTDRSVHYGNVEKFLERLVPEDWDDLSIQQRLQFYATDMRHGVKLRDKICAQELWVECLEGKLREMPKAKSHELNNILKQMGWTPHRALNYKNEYGQQRGFKRP